MRRGATILAILALGVIVGCGGSSGSSSTQSQPPPSSAARIPLSSCPGERESYESAKEMIQTGREDMAAGKEVKASEFLIRIGKERLKIIAETCKADQEIKVTEASLCSHTPAEMTARLEEGSRSAYGAAGAYEAACGKRVPNP